MSNETVAIIGCPYCKIDLFTLVGVPVEDKPGFFNHSLEAIDGYDGSHKTHSTVCGTPLKRKPVNGWPA